MFVYCYYQYQLNNDVSIVDFKEFHGNDDFTYPSVTLCLRTEFLEEKLKDEQINMDKNSYYDFLSGEFWQDSMMEVVYDNVTKSIENYFLGASIWSFYTLHSGWREYRYLHKEGKRKLSLNGASHFIPKFYTSFRDAHEKCLSFDIPNDLPDKISSFGLFFNNSIFPYGTRPREDQFGIKIHYPNQLLTAKCSKYSWKKHDFWEDYTMTFILQNIAVLTRRNKKESPCNTDWKNDDQILMKNVMNKVGCQPPHWDRMTQLPKCSTKEQIKQIFEMNLTGQHPPCKQIKKVLHTYEELKYIESNPFESLKRPNDIHFMVIIRFEDSSFMEIKHVRAFDIESLIGNAGGYLGMFTGYAILHLPSLIFLTVGWAKKRCRQSQKLQGAELHKI